MESVLQLLARLRSVVQPLPGAWNLVHLALPHARPAQPTSLLHSMQPPLLAMKRWKHSKLFVAHYSSVSLAQAATQLPVALMRSDDDGRLVDVPLSLPQINALLSLLRAGYLQGTWMAEDWGGVHCRHGGTLDNLVPTTPFPPLSTSSTRVCLQQHAAGRLECMPTRS